ncbi:TIM barrel protein [Enterovibrio sp. Hal110]
MIYSIATVCLSGTLRQKIEAISKAGFRGIEIFENDLITHNGSVHEIRSMLDDHGLEVVTYQPFRDFEGLPAPYRHKAFDRAERKFDLMEELGTDLLMVCSSVSPHALGGFSALQMTSTNWANARQNVTCAWLMKHSVGENTCAITAILGKSCAAPIMKTWAYA